MRCHAFSASVVKAVRHYGGDIYVTMFRALDRVGISTPACPLCDAFGKLDDKPCPLCHGACFRLDGEAILWAIADEIGRGVQGELRVSSHDVREDGVTVTVHEKVGSGGFACSVSGHFAHLELLAAEAVLTVRLKSEAAAAIRQHRLERQATIPGWGEKVEVSDA